jgi:hypothetical protein
MFCPGCGKAEQSPETYCRQCGLFLPDLSKPFKRKHSPEEHLKANMALNFLTVIASFTLAILLYTILGFKADTHPLIYVTAGLLTAIGGWHVQTFIRTLLLKKQWKQGTPLAESKAALQATRMAVESVSTAKMLESPDLANAIPLSVTEHTTRQLVERPQSKSS